MHLNLMKRLEVADRDEKQPRTGLALSVYLYIMVESIYDVKIESVRR